jgi:hypothetical protein
MPAFDLVIHTGAVLETGFARLRSMRAGRQLFWPNGQAALWRKVGLADVTEVPVVVENCTESAAPAGSSARIYPQGSLLQESSAHHGGD